MSVQKYRISKNSSNFTTIPNKVLQGLKNAEALGLWCYLASLPPAWEFHKEQLREHFNLGIHKLNGLLKLLEQNSLITIRQMRDSSGQFSYFDMEVDDGNNFKINDLYKNDKTPFYKNRNTVTVRTDISTYKRNKDKINKEKESSLIFKPNEQNIFLAKDLAVDINQELESFKNRHKGKKTQYEFSRWLKNAKMYQKRTDCREPTAAVNKMEYHVSSWQYQN